MMASLGRRNYLIVGTALHCLFFASIASAAPVQLNGTLPSNGTVYSARFSPDGNHVLYHADQDTQGVVELYIVPAGGGTPLKLNGALQPGGQVYELDIDFTPDGSKVVYTAEQETDDVVDLYMVPITGGPSQKLSGAHDLSVNSNEASMSADGSLITYSAREPFVQELFIVGTDGEAPMKLVSHNGGFLEFTENKFSPNGDYVVFISDLDTPDFAELYSVPVTGGSPIKLNVPLVAGSSLSLGSVRFTPDGSHVLYRAEVEEENRNELFVVPVGGGASVKLNETLQPGGRVDTDYVLSADGSEVLYVAPQDSGQNELYLTSISGGP
jgi:Tol biopolymer transport system component